MPHFLIEIGLEEVPARMLAGAQAELLKRTLALLTREQLVGAEVVAQSYSTPRRLAVLVKDVREQQDDITEDVTGPAVKIAFKDGVPTAAAEAFARKSGVALAELRTIETPKGEYLAATSVKKGRSAAAVITEELPKEIAGIYWAKNMYWRAGKPEKFVRPVVWIACLLGDAVVPVTFGGKTAGRASYGHRVLSSGEAFEIVAPESYVAQLEGEYVIADVEARRHKIRKALDRETREVSGARWREDEALVDAVTHLTEWPDVLLGSFEAEYLELPEEVLVTVMRDHQKYFAVEDPQGKLAPHFLTVTNIALDEVNTPIIKQGNERVLRARFNDARFFWEFDQRTPLVERVKLLEKVTFQKDLGSYYSKSEANVKMARCLGQFVGADDEVLRQAGWLLKADLTSELVKEFTELQGVIGGLYARRERMSESIVEAIYSQYMPGSMEDEIPSRVEAQVLGLVDRFLTILKMFGIGIQPTGSKDPFALRRAGNGVIKLLAESSLPLTLFHLFSCSDLGNMDALQQSVWAFLNERVEFYLREGRKFPNGVVRAVMMAFGSPITRYENVAALSIVTWGEEKFVNDVRDAVLRAEALGEVGGSQDFADVAGAFKRIKKIVAQADQKLEPFAAVINQEKLIESAERALYEKASSVATEVETYRSRRTREGYVQALRLIASLRPQVDAFFDQKSGGVMVMSPDAELRANRLGLMRWLLNSFLRIADFSEIVVAG